MQPDRTLLLEDGTALPCNAFGATADCSGEVVFNTGMVGYPESLTDPSYTGQILVLTYPLVGNYGVPALELDKHGLPVGFESARIHVTGLVVSELCTDYSHYRAAKSLSQWLAEQGVPAVWGVDTRALTKKLRECGTMLGRISSQLVDKPYSDPNAENLVARVTCTRRQVLCSSAPASTRPARILLIDCGCKAGIVRSLLYRGFEVVRVPYDHYFPEEDFDGLVISNGPGDPKRCGVTIRNIEHALALEKPMLGICLGTQLMGLAIGADTYKMKFGHRGQNQPCIESEKFASGEPRCVLSSQNHGFAISEGTLPDDWRVWFSNVNDGTVEGIRHVTRPYMGVQFHPEATPGPTDSDWVFDEFARLVSVYR